MLPARHGGSPHPVGNGIEQVLIGWNLPKGSGANFDMTFCQVSWSRHRIIGRWAIPFSSFAMTIDTFLQIDLLSFFQGRGSLFARFGMPLSCSLVNIGDDFPNVFCTQGLFPGWHGRVPGLIFFRKSFASFHDTPESISLRSGED